MTPSPEELVCLFLRGELGSRGAPPCPVRGCHASLPARRGSARHCRPSGSWKMLIYIRNNIRKGVPDCPAVPPIGTCVARGFKGCQAFALAEEKILKRYIQKTYGKVICSAGWVSIVLPKNKNISSSKLVLNTAPAIPNFLPPSRARGCGQGDRPCAPVILGAVGVL